MVRLKYFGSKLKMFSIERKKLEINSNFPLEPLRTYVRSLVKHAPFISLG